MCICHNTQMAQNLDESLSNFTDRISDIIKEKKSIVVTTHIDCDGLTSGSIITKALIRAGANVTVRTSKEFSSTVIDELTQDKRDFHIITDLGGGFGLELDQKLGQDNWFVLDHHEISNDEMDNPQVINAWKYQIDGGTEICAGGMAYLAAKKMDEKNVDLAPIAVISALGDRQDQGEKKSFIGKNMEIVNTAKEQGLLDTEMDILLVGRETRPLVDALAFTSHPFIDGLTWNRESCYALLNQSKIPLKDGGRWRVAADLTHEEKQTLIELIVQYTSSKNPTEVMSELIGYTYTFPREDGRSFLKDGREFSTMLNSCGRINKASVGIAICMGDRNKILKEGQSILKEYRKTIREYMNVLLGQRWRITENNNYVMINGEEIIPETMTGTITSLIAGSPKHAGKIIILRTRSEGGNTIKFSSRKSYQCKIDINLSKLMKAGAEKFHGIGGGHNAAAGAKITRNKLDEFLKYLDANVTQLQPPSNST